MEAIADTYRALLPEGSAADFQRILDLKVSKSYLLRHLFERFWKSANWWLKVQKLLTYYDQFLLEMTSRYQTCC